MDKHHNDQGSLQVYAAIVRYKIEHGGKSPSIPELVDMTGYKSTKPISDRLQSLTDMGLIKRKDGTPRSIQIVGGKWTAPSVPKGLRPRQEDVLKVIYSHAKKNDGNPPTLADISRALDFASDSTPGHHIRLLIESGTLESGDGSHRSLDIVGGKYEIDLDKVPEIGRPIAAGAIASDMVVGMLAQSGEFEKVG